MILKPGDKVTFKRSMNPYNNQKGEIVAEGEDDEKLPLYTIQMKSDCEEIYAYDFELEKIED